jgi:cytochrome P450
MGGTQDLVEPVVYDPFDPATIADPYPVYVRLRDTAPVYYVERDDVWAVSRYDDVVRLLRDTATFSSSAMDDFMTGGMLRRQRARNPWADGATALMSNIRVVISADPPEHTVLRRLMSRSFTPRAIEARRPAVQALCDSLMDDFLGAAAAGPVDFVRGVAWQLPMLVIAEMLGVPPERFEDFKRWSDDMVTIVSGVGDGFIDPTSLMELFRYFADLLDARRAGTQADDLVGLLLQSEGDGGSTLTGFEIAGFCMLLLVAGNETTTSLLGNTVAALLEQPDELDRLRGDLALVPAALEESLRYDAPFQGLYRRTTSEVELGGVTIPAGAGVVPLFGSANRDERHYADPDRFDVTRNPADHLGFGSGIHLCLGAPLARLEGEVVLRSLLERTRSFERGGDVVRMSSHVLRSVSSLPLHVVPSQ